MSEDDSTPTESSSDGVPKDVIDLAAVRRSRGLPAGAPSPERVVENAELAVAEQACKHAQVRVNIDAHVVSCGDCGDELDPVVVMHQYAVRERQLRSGDSMRSAEQKALRIEIEALKRERRNLKAAIGRDEITKKLAAAEELAKKIALERADYRNRYQRLHAQVIALGKKPCA